MKLKGFAALYRAAGLSAAACLLLTSGCAFLQNHFGRGEDTALARREPLPGAIEQKLEIPRASYRSALEQAGGVNRFRLVQVFSGGKDSSAEDPQWRIFDVQRGSVCDMLGLENADVILAANGHRFSDSEKFAAYLTLLAKENTASIQLKRAGREYLMKYIFIDPGSAQSPSDNVP